MARRVRKPVVDPAAKINPRATRTTSKKIVKKVAPKKVAPKKVAPKKVPVKKTPAKKTTKKTMKRQPTPKKAPAAKVVKEKKPKAVASGPKGYTAAEYEKFKSEKERLKNMSNAELKKMLKDNLQSMSGNKDDMILKIADGIVLGRIPRCPGCFGGRPKYDFKTGVYSCPGYRDDEDFINCHKTFEKGELKRDPWQ